MHKNILIIDDDDAILEVLKIILDEEGYTTKVLSDSHQVLKFVDHEIPDLILLDIWLSGIDGQEIAHELKSREKTKNVPIIMISANNEGEKLAKESNVDGFIAKPFEINDLLKVIKKHLSN